MEDTLVEIHELGGVHVPCEQFTLPVSLQGWVMESGSICPSLILIFGSKWVNSGKILILSPTVCLQMKNTAKNVVQYCKAFGLSAYGQIAWDFQTGP